MKDIADAMSYPVRWKEVDSDCIKIPEGAPVNVNVSPVEVKDIAAICNIHLQFGDNGFSTVERSDKK